MAGIPVPRRSELGPPRSLANADDAERALRRLRLQGFDLDPGNQEHVSAYMTLRANSSRVDGKRLVSYLASKRTNGLAMQDLRVGSQRQRP